jgi:hypothetical protein
VTEIGPVQLISVAFEPEANFEGRIADELAALEKERTIRILGLLFIARDTESDEIVVLEPGGSAGLLLIEHVWARGLRKAVRDAGGRMLGDGFLTPETIAAVEPELAAMSQAIEEMERETRMSEVLAAPAEDVEPRKSQILSI